jgi:ribonuclease D
MTVTVYKDDIPADIDWGNAVAIDSETMGLNNSRDRLCVVQLSSGDGNAILLQIAADPAPAPNLVGLLENNDIVKLFHFGRFDMAILARTFGVMPEPVYCTKIASKLARTYTDHHGLKDLCRELLGVDLSKQQQSSDWGREALSKEQKAYAASDVLYLHNLREVLDIMLVREGRDSLLPPCLEFLPARVRLDMAGWGEMDIFSH